MIELGDRARDTISGFTGIVTGKAVYLYGCRHVLIAPEESKDLKVADSTWLDEDRCEVVAKAVNVLREPRMSAGGGPTDAPRVVR